VRHMKHFQQQWLGSCILWCLLELCRTLCRWYVLKISYCAGFSTLTFYFLLSAVLFLHHWCRNFHGPIIGLFPFFLWKSAADKRSSEDAIIDNLAVMVAAEVSWGFFCPSSPITEQTCRGEYHFFSAVVSLAISCSASAMTLSFQAI